MKIETIDTHQFLKRPRRKLSKRSYTEVELPSSGRDSELLHLPGEPVEFGGQILHIVRRTESSSYAAAFMTASDGHVVMDGSAGELIACTIFLGVTIWASHSGFLLTAGTAQRFVPLLLLVGGCGIFFQRIFLCVQALRAREALEAFLKDQGHG